MHREPVIRFVSVVLEDIHDRDDLIAAFVDGKNAGLGKAKILAFERLVNFPLYFLFLLKVPAGKEKEWAKYLRERGFCHANWLRHDNRVAKAKKRDLLRHR